MRFVMVDGVECPDGKVHLDAEDPALERGRAVFETLRTYGGRLFRMEAHLGRLGKSLEMVGIEVPTYDVLRRELKVASQAVIAATSRQGDAPDEVRVSGRLREAVVRVTFTGGGRRVVVGRPLSVPPVEVRAVRRPWVAPLEVSAAKHASRLHWELLREASGAEEVIFEDPEGSVLEGSWSNVFAVRGGVFRTSPADGRILAGVTRGALLEAARELGLRVSEAPLSLDAGVDELYCSSSLKELVPVVVLDGAPGPGGGPVGARVLEAFHALVARECPGFSPPRPRPAWG